MRISASATEFEDSLTGVSGLVVNGTATARGLLVKNGFTGPGPISSIPPQLVAAKVRQ